MGYKMPENDENLATEESTEDLGVKEEKGKEEGTTAQIECLRYLMDPTLKQLQGLTNIPLGQINNLTWMVVYDMATEQLAQYVDYKNRLKEWKENPKGKEKPKFPMLFSLSEVWREAYQWLRRSINADGMMMVTQLALKQMEVEEAENEPSDIHDLGV